VDTFIRENIVDTGAARQLHLARAADVPAVAA
jgi:hypothetical protein